MTRALRIAACAGALAAAGCDGASHAHDATASASPSIAADAVSTATAAASATAGNAAATPSPSPSPSPSPAASGTPPVPLPKFTGPATLERGDAPLIGRVVADGSFVTCGGETLAILATDEIYPNGSCTVAYDVLLKTAAQNAAAAQAGGTLINGITVDGDTAIATYVRAGASGQILLRRSPAGWSAAATTGSGALDTAAAAAAGVDPARVRRLQRRLPFDVGATPLPHALVRP